MDVVDRLVMQLGSSIQTPNGERADVDAGDLVELLRRYHRALEMKKGAEEQCERLRGWYLDAVRARSGDPDFQPATVEQTILGEAEIRRVGGSWVVLLADDELHCSGDAHAAYSYYCGLITGLYLVEKRAAEEDDDAVG